MSLGELLEERRRSLVRSDADDALPDDEPRVGSRIEDLEERDACPREAGQDRPRNRSATTVTGKQRRVHPEDAHSTPTHKGDEVVSHELRPPDDEDQLRS